MLFSFIFDKDKVYSSLLFYYCIYSPFICPDRLLGTRCLYNNILASNLKLSRRWWNRCHLPHASAGPALWETSEPIKTIRDYEMPSYDAGRTGFPLQDTFHLKMITLRQELHLFLKQNVLLGFLQSQVHCLSLTLVIGIIIFTQTLSPSATSQSNIPNSLINPENHWRKC